MSHFIPNTGTDERLAGLERFMEFWLGPRRPEYGEPAQILSNVQLPDPLRRFLAFAGRWPPVHPPNYLNCFCNQDRILPLIAAPYGNLCIHGDRLIFAVENQGVWVVATSPTGTDPAVWLSEDFFDRKGDNHWHPQPESRAAWELTCDSLSHFLVTFTLQEMMYGSKNLAAQENAMAVFNDAGCKIEPLWVNAEYTWRKRWPDIRLTYYLVDDRILLQTFVGDDVAVNDQWYAFNDPTCCDFLQQHKLPISVRS